MAGCPRRSFAIESGLSPLRVKWTVERVGTTKREPTKVFNLEVAFANAYYVGRSDVLVHNTYVVHLLSQKRAEVLHQNTELTLGFQGTGTSLDVPMPAGSSTSSSIGPECTSSKARIDGIQPFTIMIPSRRSTSSPTFTAITSRPTSSACGEAFDLITTGNLW